MATNQKTLWKSSKQAMDPSGMTEKQSWEISLQMGGIERLMLDNELKRCRSRMQNTVEKSLKTHVKSRSYSPYMKLLLDFLMVDQSLVLTNGAKVKPFRIGTDRNRSHFLACQCQHKDGISGISRDDGSGARRKESIKCEKSAFHEATVHKVLGIQELNEARHENGAHLFGGEICNY
ncbi:hypothetical protein HPP92_007822 [Vanilla planifolia]|uniref:Uncharacterized protein n=1 Tax=Vanilla planifolia TaxID=51239 RepID=A0A835VAF2_VANPL|nr:hypothetical protein HPP92_007822 [Vanilla planifolia]